jgi:hypothetical protein
MSTKDNFPYHNAGLSIGQLNENLKACRWEAQNQRSRPAQLQLGQRARVGSQPHARPGLSEWPDRRDA